MSFHRILLATDFSALSEAARKVASQIARANAATLLIANVEDPTVFGEPSTYYVPKQEMEAEIVRKLSAVLPEDPATVFEHRLLRGEPAAELVRLAESEHVDLIVLGTQGRKGLNRLLLGSVAEHVVRMAPCAVLTVGVNAASLLAAEGDTSGLPGE